MTIQWTDIELPLGGGIDSKTNEKLLKPPASADLSDAVFPASGVAGYETRKGYDRIRTTTAPANIDSLATRENELAVCADHKLYSVSELANNVDLISKGNLHALRVNQETLDTQSVNQTLGQIITHNGVQVHCWLDSGTSTIQYTVTDAVTGTVISADNSIANSTRAKLTKIGTTILILYFQSSATSLRATRIPTYAPTSTTDTEVRSDARTTGLFDVIEISSTLQGSFVAYHADEGEGDNIKGFLLSEAGVASQVTEVSVNTPLCLAVGVTDTAFEVLHYVAAGDMYINESTGGNLGTIDTFVTEDNETPATAVVKVAYVYAESAHHVWADHAGATNRDNFVTYYTSATLAGLDFTTATATLHHSSIASNAFILDDLAYVHVAHDTPLQSMYFLVNGSAEVQAKCCENVGRGDGTVHTPRVIDGTWAPVYREHLQVDLNPEDSETAADVFSQTGLKLVTYDLTHRPSAIEYGRTAYIASGILWAYDGAVLAEQGFHIYPEMDSSNIAHINETASDGALTLLNSYSYRVYYEWTNARGERQRSTTATALTFQLTGTFDEITINVPTLAHTSKGTNVSIVVYRTQGNPNLNGGAPFYRVSDPNPANNTGDNRYVANVTTAATVAFVDTMADTAILTKELDYLNSGEFDNVAPKSAAIIGESKKRVWLAGFEKESRAQFSKLNSRGRDQLEFHDGNTFVDVPEEDGPITAFGALNFHTLIFKANSIYAVSGEGPNNIGQGFFNLPQVVSLDVGCTEQRSVVNTPAGVMFKSNKGIWLVGQNLQVQYIGANVEVYNSQDITDATIVPEENHVVFLTSSGSTLVYNYLVQQWLRWTNHTGHDAVIWNGTYTYARTDGRLYRQGAVYSDDGVHYTMRWVSAPISLRGIQGRQKIRYIRLLGEYYSPHNLRVGLRFDHEPGTADAGTWDPGSAISVDAYGLGYYGGTLFGGDLDTPSDLSIGTLSFTSNDDPDTANWPTSGVGVLRITDTAGEFAGNFEDFNYTRSGSVFTLGTAISVSLRGSSCIITDSTGTSTFNESYGGDGSPVYQARFNFPRQSCQTVQLVVDTVNTSSAGRAMSIEAIQISAGHEEGSAQLEVARSFSATGASTT